MANVYEIATEPILEALEKGYVPWDRPWFSAAGGRTGAWRHRDGKPFAIFNQLTLLPGEYLSYKEIQEDGGSLKEDHKTFKVYSYFKVKDDPDDPDNDKEHWRFKYYRVFHISDCIGISQKYLPDEPRGEGVPIPERIKAGELLANQYFASSGVSRKHDLMEASYYTPQLDVVHMPDIKQFKTAELYYATLFHEIAHSTGHPDRLDRFKLDHDFTMDKRSVEELAAELTAAALMSYLGLDTAKTRENTVSYIANWRGAMGDDARLIVNATSMAQKALDFILEAAGRQ